VDERRQTARLATASGTLSCRRTTIKVRICPVPRLLTAVPCRLDAVRLLAALAATPTRSVGPASGSWLQGASAPGGCLPLSNVQNDPLQPTAVARQPGGAPAAALSRRTSGRAGGGRCRQPCGGPGAWRRAAPRCGWAPVRYSAAGETGQGGRRCGRCIYGSPARYKSAGARGSSTLPCALARFSLVPCRFAFTAAAPAAWRRPKCGGELGGGQRAGPRARSAAPHPPQASLTSPPTPLAPPGGR
jgi:hypothetical protein